MNGKSQAFTATRLALSVTVPLKLCLLLAPDQALCQANREVLKYELFFYDALRLLHRWLTLLLRTRQHSNQLDLNPQQVPSLFDIKSLDSIDDLVCYLAQLFHVLFVGTFPLLPLELISSVLHRVERLKLSLELADALVERIKVAEPVVVLLEVAVEQAKSCGGVQGASQGEGLQHEVLHARRDLVSVNELQSQLVDSLFEFISIAILTEFVVKDAHFQLVNYFFVIQDGCL